MTRPSSQTPRPPALWPPPRMETGKPVLAPKRTAVDDVGHVGALRDQARLAADHGVVDFAGLVVARVFRLDQFAAELSSELIDG